MIGVGVMGAASAAPTGEVAAVAPRAEGVGIGLPLELHRAPDAGAVGPEVGLDVGGDALDGGRVPAEQLGASVWGAAMGR
jgi:hypothetical protein